jgi:hypothetical protein
MKTDLKIFYIVKTNSIYYTGRGKIS